MLNIGTCPACSKPVNDVKIENITLKLDVRVHYPGVSFVCSQCKTVLGVNYDHNILNDNTKKDILKALGIKK